MTSEQKIAEVEAQLRSLEQERSNIIECPYCSAQTKQGAVLCCLTLGKAVRAILQRQVTKELADNAERIGEAIHAAKQN